MFPKSDIVDEVHLWVFHIVHNTEFTHVQVLPLPLPKPNHMGNDIQPAVTPSVKVGKKKENLQKNPQILFEWNLKEYFRYLTTLVVRDKTSSNALCNDRATFTWHPQRKCKKSKNRQKTKKHVFFKFLTHVKSNMCKKWGVGSTYTSL
jgi:hypothetical protein